jgi:hypothetical protein
MIKTILVALLSFNVFFGNGSANLLEDVTEKRAKKSLGTIEKMIPSNGEVLMSLDLNRLNGGRIKGSNVTDLRFEIDGDSFFSIVVYNNELRGFLPSSMGILPQNSTVLPAKLNDSIQQLVIESTQPGEPYELIVRDAKSGFVFFNIEGQELNYQPNGRLLIAENARLLLTREFAAAMGRSADAGANVGKFSFSTVLRPIEVSEVVDEEIVSTVLPPDPVNGTTPGPDVVVGDLVGLAQFGSSSGSQVGLAVGTDSCNYGTVNLNWFANPSNDHPVIPQNLYRMSGGADNTQQFEQIGQSQVKHAFTALTQNLCNLGCNGVGGSQLGSGCSDPYSASLNSGPNLGSKAWINPFTGFFPRNDSATPNNSHTGHTHVGTSHRILTEISDLSTTSNPGATYFAEAQYVTPHEYAHCQANPTQCNMYNNVSYRRYSVTGTGSPFSFSPVGTTVRQKPAIEAWTGATINEIRPAPGTDGVGFVAYKVTNPSAGVWHYEYVVYNMNLDRAIQSFSVPLGSGITISNIGFRMPPQHPASANDGTVGSAGFSSTPWSQSQTSSSMSWSSETFAQNPNANAIRWSTAYNFRFDSNRPPQTATATVGFFKTGSPITVQVQAPTPVAATNVSVAGRVMSTSGVGIRGAIVTMTDSMNNTRTTTTGTFGYYHFDNVATGSYTVSVVSGRYTFSPQVVQINDNIAGLNFLAQQPQ